MKAWYFTVTRTYQYRRFFYIHVPPSAFPPISFYLAAIEKVCGAHTLRAEEFARDVEGLASYDDDLLAVQKLLGDGACETTKQMALAIDDNLRFRVSRDRSSGDSASIGFGAFSGAWFA